MAENIFCGTIRSAETYSNAGEKILNSEKSPFFSMLVVKIYFSASYWGNTPRYALSSFHN